jgi:hypothetical protein
MIYKLKSLVEKGTLKKIERFIKSGGGFIKCNRKYTATQDDELLVLRTTGTSLYTNDTISITTSVMLYSTKPKSPEPGIETALYDSEIIRVFEKDNAIYVENYTDAYLIVYLSFTKRQHRQ